MPQPTLKAPVGQKFRKKIPKVTSVTVIGPAGDLSAQSISNLRKLTGPNSPIEGSIQGFHVQTGIPVGMLKDDFDNFATREFPQFSRELFRGCRATLNALVEELRGTTNPKDFTKIIALLENDSEAMQRIKEGFHLLYQLDVRMLQSGAGRKAAKFAPNTTTCNSFLTWMITEPMSRGARGCYGPAHQVSVGTRTDPAKVLAEVLAICNLVPYGVTPLTPKEIIPGEDPVVPALWCMLAKAANANSYLLQYYMGLTKAEFKAELPYHSMNIITALLVLRPDSELLRGTIEPPESSLSNSHQFSLANWELWKGYLYLNQALSAQMNEGNIVFPTQLGDTWMFENVATASLGDGLHTTIIRAKNSLVPTVIGLGNNCPITLLSKIIPTQHTLKVHWENNQEVLLSMKKKKGVGAVPSIDMECKSLALTDMSIKLGQAYQKLYNNRVSVGLYPAKLDPKFEKKNPGALPGTILVIGVQEGAWTLLPVFYGWDINYLPTFLIPLHKQTINNLLSVYRITRSTHPPATATPPKELYNDWLSAHGGYSAPLRNLSMAGIQAFLTSGIAFNVFPRRVQAPNIQLLKGLSATPLVPSNFRVADIRDFMGDAKEERKSSQNDLVAAFSLGGPLKDSTNNKRALTNLFGAP